ncbi:MAG TPA: hypothetical protein VMD29_00410 [Terracidiphilus sp.]|nr:hypothetical protein [Terracidiphilus sp.]
MSTEPENTTHVEPSENKALRAIGWFSVGMAVASIGIYLGYELRCMYKWRKRTPYDFYAKSEAQQANEFGVGI